ncbi:MAG: M15 family metallopeptidase [Ferruginibacter sp.]
MPVETAQLKKAELVELIKLDSTIQLDIRYATLNNFIKKPVYKEARAFLQRPAAEQLVLANTDLKKLGYRLLVFDGYRPWSVTKLFWDHTSKKNKKFVADPKKGSRHNRGCAVDVSLFEMATGKEVSMPGVYDENSERSYPSYSGGTAEQRAARDLLKKTMESHGFTVYEFEWWHFDFNDWKSYPLLNIPFHDIK